MCVAVAPVNVIVIIADGGIPKRTSLFMAAFCEWRARNTQNPLFGTKCAMAVARCGVAICPHALWSRCGMMRPGTNLPIFRCATTCNQRRCSPTLFATKCWLQIFFWARHGRWACPPLPLPPSFSATLISFSEYNECVIYVISSLVGRCSCLLHHFVFAFFSILSFRLCRFCVYYLLLYNLFVAHPPNRSFSYYFFWYVYRIVGVWLLAFNVCRPYIELKYRLKLWLMGTHNWITIGFASYRASANTRYMVFSLVLRWFRFVASFMRV